MSIKFSRWFEAARTAKWNAYRREHGLQTNTTFVGHPVHEMVGELLDLANYADVANEHGHLDDVEVNAVRYHVDCIVKLLEQTGA